MADMRTDSDGLTEPLTEREQEILACLFAGLSNQEIADRLYLSVTTVRWYNSQIYSKLNVNNREAALAVADGLGLLEVTSDAAIRMVADNNLPAQTTSFVGRHSELVEIARLLGQAETRLITILAPGGMGKTRLALEAARRQLMRYSDGVYFVPLAPLSSPNDIVSAIADNVGLGFHSSSDPKQQLLDHFRERTTLLVLDNFEHLVDGAALVTDIIQFAPDVKIIVTSREKLQLSGETVFILSGMHFSDWETAENALDYDAVQLFIQSTQRSRPDLALHAEDMDSLAHICRLTAGMPLALVLAAGWVDVLTLEQIAVQLQQGIDILETEMRDIPERQRSVRASFHYTWERLGAAERDIFMKLSVFRGGFTAEAAVAVAGASLRYLRKLVNRALVQSLPSGRYDMHELLRQYAEEHLHQTSGETETVQDLHSRYFADFLHQQEYRLKGPQLATALNEIEAEIDNIRVGWQRAIVRCDLDAIGASLQSLILFYMMRSRRQEGDQTLSLVLPCLETVEDLLLAQALMALASFKISRDHSKFIELAGRGLEICRNLGSPSGLGLSVGYLALRLKQIWPIDEIERVCQEALNHAEESGDLWEVAWSLYTLGDLSLNSGKVSEAVLSLTQSIETFRALGSRWALTFPLGSLETALDRAGEYEQSRELNEEGLAICREIGDREGIIWRCSRLAHIAHAQQDSQRTKYYLREIIQLALELQLNARIHEFGANLIFELLLEAGQVVQAVEFVAMLQADMMEHASSIHHLDTAERFKARYAQQLDELEIQLPPDTFIAAREWGEKSSIRETMVDLLNGLLAPNA